jgi:hypothetical protein
MPADRGRGPSVRSVAQHRRTWRWLDSDHPHALGSIVELHHPEAGSIRATVSEIGLGSIRISFDGAEQAIAYALSAITSDMTRS